MRFRSEKSRVEYFEAYDSYERNWPVRYNSKLIRTSPYGSTFVRISGAESSPPLVLLPAAHSNSLIWASCIEELTKHYRVYAIDPIFNHGKSVLENKVSTVSELVEWIDSLLNGLELEGEINLCGMSLGGWISAQYALARPHKIRRLALLAPAATFLRIRPEFLFRGIIAATVPLQRASESFNEWLLNVSGTNHSDKKPPGGAFSTLMYSSAKAYKIPVFYPIPTVLSDKELENISKLNPLVLIGEHDQMYSVKKAVNRLQKVAPKIEVQTVPRAGHSFIRSHAPQISPRLVEFIG